MADKKEKTAPKEEKVKETTEERFNRMANRRMRNILISLKRLGNLASGAYRHDGHIQRYNGLLDIVSERAQAMKASSAIRPKEFAFDIEKALPTTATPAPAPAASTP
jgi:hypothetical protein